MMGQFQTLYHNYEGINVKFLGTGRDAFCCVKRITIQFAFMIFINVNEKKYCLVLNTVDVYMHTYINVT